MFPTIKKSNKELPIRFERWLKLQRYSPISIDMYVRAVREFIRYLGDKSVMRCTHLDVQEFLATQASKGLLPRTVLYKLYSIRIFFDFLSLGGLIQWSPPRIIKMRKVERRTPRLLTTQEVRRIFNKARTPQERALLSVLYYTGCRTDEVRTLLIENIDYKQRRIKVTGKVGIRYVFFPTAAAQALRIQIGKRKQGYVFVDTKPQQALKPSPSGNAAGGWRCRWKKYDTKGKMIGIGNCYIPSSRGMTYQEAWAYFTSIAGQDNAQRPVGTRPLGHAAIQKAVQKIALRAGIIGANPRSFRHTYATQLLDNGADLRIVQELMGHTSIRTTEVYTHVSKRAVQKAYNRFHPTRGKAK